jgi:diaminopimelate epimerase
MTAGPRPAGTETLSFFKVSGGGNDFIALFEPATAPDRQQVRTLSRRGLSIGGDGLFLLRRLGDGRVAMEHFNPDGSIAALCLNGTRCAARCVFELGWAQDQVRLLTGAGEILGQEAGEERIRLRLPLPDQDPQPVKAEVEGFDVTGWRTVIGVPHLVLPWPTGLARAPVGKIGAALVHHAQAGPDGANVNFVHVTGRGRFEIRTYERGVDGETLACGTGVMATSHCLFAADQLEFPATALTAGGFEITVEAEVEEGRIGSWAMVGDARVVARGEILPGAHHLPSPPVWSETD